MCLSREKALYAGRLRHPERIWINRNLCDDSLYEGGCLEKGRKIGKQHILFNNSPKNLKEDNPFLTPNTNSFSTFPPFGC